MAPVGPGRLRPLDQGALASQSSARAQDHVASVLEAARRSTPRSHHGRVKTCEKPHAAKGKGVTRNSGPRHHFPSLSMMMSGNRSMAGVGPATPITGWHALVGCESRSFFWSAAGGAQNFVRKHVGNRWKEKQKKSSARDPIFGGFAIEATPLPVLSTGPSCFTSGLSLNQTRYWDWHIYRHRPYSIYQPGTHLTSVLIG